MPMNAGSVSSYIGRPFFEAKHGSTSKIFRHMYIGNGRNHVSNARFQSLYFVYLWLEKVNPHGKGRKKIRQSEYKCGKEWE